MANDTPNDLDSGAPIELVAIRRVRAALRETDDALDEVEGLLTGASPISRQAVVRAGARALGELGDISHEVRRELLAIFGLYPF